eukprot:CAMPEP_0173057868 /NCGR_PEP_ID=MMETSP1102-20130122/1015_1 /TAXON_ID=49646 /ORGANISM="Geminigera sp., Strain Caron Lab Isolate" /LENGTH=274 /DNA_ID=CAMNT_0013923503 /DNA_START=72 /DNA_END=896 /DNA_ORIENTATION=+
MHAVATSIRTHAVTTSKLSMRHDANSPYDRMLEIQSGVPLNLDLREKVKAVPLLGVSVLGGQGNMRGYRSTRLAVARNQKVWARLVTLARSLGGVTYGIMFDLTALSSSMITVSAIASGSGPQVKPGSKVWIFICQGSHTDKTMQAHQWSQVGEGALELVRPSFKASLYTDYSELPLQQSFDIYPHTTVGVCLMSSSPEGMIVREGEALKNPTQSAKCLRQYVVPGPNSAADTSVDGGLQVSVASIISSPQLFAEEPKVHGGFVGGITYSYASI